MNCNPTFDVFPCPFCRSGHVSRIGGARSFVHYRCTDCEEVWTAMRAPSVREKGSPRLMAARVGAAKTTYH